MHTAFFPSADDVTPDYWEYTKWRAAHRLFSSITNVFATQVHPFNNLLSNKLALTNLGNK